MSSKCFLDKSISNTLKYILESSAKILDICGSVDFKHYFPISRKNLLPICINKTT